MELLFYLLIPFVWLFMLIEWFYKSLRTFFYWIIGEPEPGTAGNRGREPEPARKQKTAGQGQDITTPDRKRPKDDGMNPQERTIPRFTMKPKPEPEQKPKKKKLPTIIFEPPKKPDKERRGMEM